MNNRKIIHRHQNVLIYFKGNPSEIKESFSPLDKYMDSLEDSELLDE